MPNIHPMFVHFPVALLTVSFLFDLFGFVLRREDLRSAGLWTMIAGFVGLIAAVSSGLIAETGLMPDAGALETLANHKQLAFVAAIVYAILVFWRVGGKGKLPVRRQWVFWLLYGGGVGLVWVVSWLGGTLVYTHRIAFP